MTIPALPELAFSPIPAPSRPRHVGDRFSFMAAGPSDAPAVVLLHGIGANAMHWRFQLAGLSDRFRVVAWNAPGYMLSDPFRSETPDWRDYADALADFLDGLGIGQAHLVGNSFGTRLAQHFALLHPLRVGRLVLTGTGVGRADLSEAERGAALRAREAQVAAGGWSFGERVAALLGPEADAGTIERVRHVLRATNPAGFLQAVRCGLRPVCTLDFAARLTMPVLLIQGEADRVNPLADNAGPLVAALPDARLEVLGGIGHLPEAEAPEAVNALLRRFLSPAAG